MKARSHEVVVLLLLGLVDSIGIIRCLWVIVLICRRRGVVEA